MIGRPALQVLSVVAAEGCLTEKVKCVLIVEKSRDIRQKKNCGNKITEVPQHREKWIVGMIWHGWPQPQAGEICVDKTAWGLQFRQKRTVETKNAGSCTTLTSKKGKWSNYLYFLISLIKAFP